jgi:hypothetical protein
MPQQTGGDPSPTHRNTALKYLYRYGKKAGHNRKDILKTIHYCLLLSPVRFRDLYERQRRKDDHGDFKEWSEGQPRSIVKYTVATYLTTEEALIKIFVEATKKLVDAGHITYTAQG